MELHLIIVLVHLFCVATNSEKSTKVGIKSSNWFDNVIFSHILSGLCIVALILIIFLLCMKGIKKKKRIVSTSAAVSSTTISNISSDHNLNAETEQQNAIIQQNSPISSPITPPPNSDSLFSNNK